MYHIRRLGIGGRHYKDFVINRAQGYDCYLMLFVKTKAVFCFDGEETVSEPDTFILYNINSPHVYRAFDNCYINDWIQFDSDDEISFPFDRLIHIGEAADISGYVKLMLDSFYRCNEHACSRLISAMLSEVSMISGNTAYRSPHSSKLMNLRKEIYARPETEWSVKAMAKRVHISEPYFQELYKGLFGISCGADVISARIESAKVILMETDLSIVEIGLRCGYNSPVHFSRQFKQITKLSPSEYRRLRRIQI